MKRLTTTAIAVFLLSVAFAQKPTDGSFTIETQINFQTGTAPINIFTPNIRVRYFISNDLALRLQFAYLSDKTTITVMEMPDGTGAEGSATMSSSLFTFRPGIEKHFAGTNRLAPYLGAELNIQLSSAKETLDQAKYSGYDYFYEEGTSAEITGNWYSSFPTWSAGSTIGLNLLAGLDFYCTDNLYIGGELGWGFNAFSGKDTEGTYTDTNGTYTFTSPGDKMSGFSMVPSGFIRVGWLIQ